MKILRQLLGAALAVFLLVDRAAAQAGSEFMVGSLPRRLALVVGNGAYVHTTQLPGSRLDADKVSAMLKDLDFDVTPVADVMTRSDFVENYLRPFMSRISEGDVVVFYFSGHGFSYGGENYIAPLDFNLTVNSNQIFGTFISTSGIEMQATDRRAGLVLMILDACRNIPNFKVETDNKNDSNASKGLAEPRAQAPTAVYWFSSALGATSIGSAVGKLSEYTEALIANMPVAGRDLQKILQEVRILVMFKTGNGQVPWTTQSSSAEFFFKPTAAILEEQKKIWQAVLQDGTKFQVVRFLNIYGTGPYGAAARSWLEKNPDAPQMRASSVSPATAEAAWTSGFGQSILLPRVGGNLVAQATDTSKVVILGSLNTVLGSPASAIVTNPSGTQNAIVNGKFVPVGPSGDLLGGSPTILAQANADWLAREEKAEIATARTGEPILASARALNRLGGGVVVDKLDARTLPDRDSPVARSLPKGATVAIDGLSFDDASKTTWFRARTSKDDTSFFIEQKASRVAPIDVGTPRREVSLQSKAEGMRSMVDAAPLVDTLDKLKSEGTKVTWVTIATPKSVTPDADAVSGLQAVYIKSVLASRGISQDIVTTSEGISDTGLRVRIFGQGGAQ